MTAANQHRAEADAAKASLMDNLERLKIRLAPARLANDVWETTREKAAIATEQAVDTVRERPVMAGSAVGAVVLALAHRPIFRFLKRFSASKDQSGPSEGHQS
jgi:hypothetical protein